jgi:hypothetical protein
MFLPGLLRWLQGAADANDFYDGCRIEYDLRDATTAGVNLTAAERTRINSCPDCEFAFAVVARNAQVVTQGGWDSGNDTAAPVPGCGISSQILGIPMQAPASKQFYGYVEDYDYNGTPIDVWLRHDGASWGLVDNATFNAATGKFEYRELVTYGILAP